MVEFKICNLLKHFLKTQLELTRYRKLKVQNELKTERIL